MEEMGCVAQEKKEVVSLYSSLFHIPAFVQRSISKCNIIIIFKYYYGHKNDFRHHKAENVPFPFCISTVPIINNNNNLLHHMSPALFYGPIKQMNSAHVEFCVHQLVSVTVHLMFENLLPFSFRYENCYILF